MSNDSKREADPNAHPHAAASLDPAYLAELQRADRALASGELDGVKYKVNGPFNPKAPRYPNVDTHLWGAWPFLAIEMEGYGDLSAHDAATGRSVWAQCFSEGTTPYDALRKLADVLEHVKFFDGDADAPPVSRT